MIFEIIEEDLIRYSGLNSSHIGKWLFTIHGCVIGIYSSREEAEGIFDNLRMEM
jgi:hypothetical protein